ncbi:putative FmdB family regulatory protein [Trinickia symbiotica]|uniref:FmdB family transcriptional regulator n=1 Tax=Trinickia symbiotica TaxID=863227 RepID=A0A2N7X4I1_9BURK|nr:FmdB family zinc ribbon protein [Trinickia symbiotica]PMS36365.1 FmdB family transcriptional regulator [Trinickia symbiotica]PPK44820.1 putative FmdB family regulatory protein [Trinickia symbiotica]
MPIYAYRCESCGFEKDVLQKISDAPLTQCPECHSETFRKQLTAAGFQLKGSGWYVTDFRGGSSGGKGANGAKGADSGTKEAGGSNSGESNAGATNAGAANAGAATGAPTSTASSTAAASSTSDA